MLHMPFDKWSLGLYLGSNCLQGVLLQRSLGRINMQGFWYREMLAGETVLGAVESFLEPILAHLMALKKLPNLVVNLGLPHESCAWQPLPAGGLVMWQRQAAMHWQLDLSQVYLDVVPIAPKTALLISTPRQPLAHVLQVVTGLQTAVTKPLRLCLDTDVTAVLKLWPWRLKQQLVLAAWQGGDTGVFVDAAGLHGCGDDDLPEPCTLILYCGEDSPIHGSKHWQVQGLPREVMLAWHLACLPSRWARQAWQVSKL